MEKSLNPCCNGIYSMRIETFDQVNYLHVLILVVMEYTQWDNNADLSARRGRCLNPCCNGIYSMSIVAQLRDNDDAVLILVVMEYTQWVCSKTYCSYSYVS